VTVTKQGQSPKKKEFACADGSGSFGEVGAGTYGINVEGLDSNGKVVAQDYGATTSFGASGPPGPIDATLHPKAANVVVSWTLQGGRKCPTGVVLPYYVDVYKLPTSSGKQFGQKVGEVQKSCSAGHAPVSDVRPGKYVVQVDSRAVTPDVKGTAKVTVEPGTDAKVSVAMQ